MKTFLRNATLTVALVAAACGVSLLFLSVAGVDPSGAAQIPHTAIVTMIDTETGLLQTLNFQGYDGPPFMFPGASITLLGTVLPEGEYRFVGKPRVLVSNGVISSVKVLIEKVD